MGSTELPLSRAHVIGILDMALFPNLNQALDGAFHLAEQGATIIEARPPYLEDPSLMSTVVQWFEHAAPRTGLALGIGTSQPELARQAATAGAVLITPPAGAIEPAWAEAVASAGAALLLRATNVLPPSSRAKSTPSPRQGMDALIGWFDQQIGTARSQGITDDHLLLDPGLGSTPLEGAQPALLHRLRELLSLGHPLALSFDQPDEGTQPLPTGAMAAVAGFAIAQGVTFLRGRSVSLLAEAARAAAAIALPFTH
ncbi:MAG: dihydropteroate synthase [Chloroflexi bacterium]|nr:dihydropteroate synthase [Chloroflexota bacterium]